MNPATPVDSRTTGRLRFALRVLPVFVITLCCALTANETLPAIPQVVPAKAGARAVTHPAAGDTTRLDAGSRIEREIAGDDRHAYELALAADESARLTIDHPAIELIVRVLNPAGAPTIAILPR